ncbi:hypothetical protein C4585_01005 [Candidatus Parcubacteria bacterium]|nr:MAG: hypothetical protein C4585_01005 [Candidatus Parcubacteria bacterium]
MEFAELFGYAGMVTGVSFLIPQIYKTYQTKSVEDLSWGMLSMFFLNCIFWSTYGILIGALPIVLTNLCALVVNITLITLKIRYRNNP